MSNDTIRGTTAAGYEPVADAFRVFFDKKWDTGAGVSVYRGDEPVVQLTGGSRIAGSDEATPYNPDTIQLVASTTKFVESLCIALLVDRGLVRYDDRIAEHWPEFANSDANKATVTIRQLMMHRAGLPVFDRKLGDEELFDFDARAFSRGSAQLSRTDWRVAAGAGESPELDLAVAYVTNTLGARMAMNDPRGLALLDAAVECARGD